MQQKKKKVVAYCRVSTLEQKKNGYGIDIQIRDATLCAESHGLLVERFYNDEAVSGVKEDRKALKQLMKDCRYKRIGIVILPSLDRLSREVRIAENLFYEFNKYGIRVLIADMPQYKGGQKDIFIRQILEAVAEEGRRSIIKRLLKGRQERVRKGLFPGGNLPYGYIREDKAVTIHPEEAERVRDIFDLTTQGLRGQKIADELNRLGHSRRNDKPWTQKQVWRILNRKNLYQDGILHYGGVLGENSALAILA